MVLKIHPVERQKEGRQQRLRNWVPFEYGHTELPSIKYFRKIFAQRSK